MVQVDVFPRQNVDLGVLITIYEFDLLKSEGENLTFFMSVHGVLLQIQLLFGVCNIV